MLRGAGERRLRLSGWFDGLPLLWEALEQLGPGGREAGRPEIETLKRRVYLNLIGRLDRAELARACSADDAAPRREVRLVAEFLFSREKAALSPPEESQLVEEVLDMVLPSPAGG